MNSSIYPGRRPLGFKLFLYFFLLSTHCALSQNEEAKIELPVNWANDFSFISNHSGYACLFLDQKDKYCILLLDSSYREVAEFKDSYYTATTPDFVGSISDATGFELFFKRIEDNVLLVLKIDIKTKKINRIKDFKITGNTSEKILYTGSNLGGNKMLTISYDKSNLIFKKHLFGLKTENTEIPISAEDYKRLKDNGYSYLQAFDDTLIMISRGQTVTDKNPVYTAYYFDLRNITCRKFDFGCGQEKTQPYLYADFLEIRLCWKTAITSSSFSMEIPAK